MLGGRGWCSSLFILVLEKVTWIEGRRVGVCRRYQSRSCQRYGKSIPQSHHTEVEGWFHRRHSLHWTLMTPVFCASYGKYLKTRLLLGFFLRCRTWITREKCLFECRLPRVDERGFPLSDSSWKKGPRYDRAILVRASPECSQKRRIWIGLAQWILKPSNKKTAIRIDRAVVRKPFAWQIPQQAMLLRIREDRRNSLRPLCGNRGRLDCGNWRGRCELGLNDTYPIPEYK